MLERVSAALSVKISGCYSIASQADALDALTEHPHEQGLTPHKLAVDRLSHPTG